MGTGAMRGVIIDCMTVPLTGAFGFDLVDLVDLGIMLLASVDFELCGI